MRLTTSMLSKPFQVTIDNMDGDFVKICRTLIFGPKSLSRQGRGIFTFSVESFCPGHGEEYFYEDDGTWTSLCLALSPPGSDVS